MNTSIVNVLISIFLIIKIIRNMLLLRYENLLMYNLELTNNFFNISSKLFKITVIYYMDR